MELPIKTVVILVALLVLVAVLLILLSRGGSNLTDIGGDVSECEMYCYKCFKERIYNVFKNCDDLLFEC